MKKILNFLLAATLIQINSSNLVACKDKIHEYTPEKLKELKEKNNINTKNNILEWIAPQEKLFNEIDNKYYYVVWRDSKNNNWNINKFNNNKEIILITDDTRLQKTKFGSECELVIRVPEIKNMSIWKKDDGTYFKAVYRWNGEDKKLPNLDIDSSGNIKFNT